MKKRKWNIILLTGIVLIAVVLMVCAMKNHSSDVGASKQDMFQKALAEHLESVLKCYEGVEDVIINFNNEAVRVSIFVSDGLVSTRVAEAIEKTILDSFHEATIEYIYKDAK